MIVYLVTNKVNGKQYVGQTGKSLRRRVQGHKSKGNLLTRAIVKYGESFFVSEVLHEAKTQEELNFCEIFYIELLRTKVPMGYNLTDGGEGPIGHKHSLSTCAKISLALRKRVRKPETYRKVSRALHGRKVTSEERDRLYRMSLGNQNHKGFKASKESRERMS